MPGHSLNHDWAHHFIEKRIEEIGDRRILQNYRYRDSDRERLRPSHEYCLHCQEIAEMMFLCREEIRIIINEAIAMQEQDEFQYRWRTRFKRLREFIRNNLLFFLEKNYQIAARDDIDYAYELRIEAIDAIIGGLRYAYQNMSNDCTEPGAGTNFDP